MRGLVTCPMDAEDRLRQDSDKIPTPNKVRRNKGPGNEVPKEYQNKTAPCVHFLVARVGSLDIKGESKADLGCGVDLRHWKRYALDIIN